MDPFALKIWYDRIKVASTQPHKRREGKDEVQEMFRTYGPAVIF